MAHTTTPAPAHRPFGERVTIGDGITAYARHLTTSRARIGRGSWLTVRDHHGVVIGHVNRPELVPALVAYTR